MNKKNLASILPFVILNFYELHLGARIKKIRKFLEISQVELAKRLKVTRKTIIEYEKNKDILPLSTLEGIARALCNDVYFIDVDGLLHPIN